MRLLLEHRKITWEYSTNCEEVSLLVAKNAGTILFCFLSWVLTLLSIFIMTDSYARF